jgi:DNA polymerase (family 10)
VTTNDRLASLLEEFADRLEAEDVEYKPRAYRRAAESVANHPTPLVDAYAEGGQDAIEELDHVGDAIASKLAEYLDTGAIDELEELRSEMPADVEALTRVEGVGPKTVGTLYRELGIETLDDLEAAAEAGDIQEVKGFGAKTEGNILDGIDFARQAHERQLLGDARPLADGIVDHLADVAAVERCETAGSLRRWKPTIGDVDVLVATEDAGAVVDAFTDWDRTDTVIEAGESKAALRVQSVRVDLRTVAPDEFGSALQYFTGSKGHNITLRNYALDRGVSLNEYGAFDVSDVADHRDDERPGDRIAGDTEASMYAALDLPWIPPELREDRGEVVAAADDALPDLVEEGDVRGDLHTHTDWSDGTFSVEEMAQAAADFGHDYLCVSDHATGPGVVGGMGVEDDELLEQADVVREVAETVDVELFAGVEANVDADGGISVADDVLAELDLVVASPHSALDQDSTTATDRLVAAMEHPHVDVLGHPSGRLLNRREGMGLDAARLGAAAAEHGVALEVNSNPHRLDLWGGAAKAAVEEGATLVVNTDAHGPPEFEYVRYGVHTARRGWAETDDVLNTRDADGVRAFCEE